MEPSEKPPCRPVRRGRKRADAKEFVRRRIDRAVQPVVVSVQADRFLVNRGLSAVIVDYVGDQRSPRLYLVAG